MSILAIVIASIGGGCLWFANMFLMGISPRAHFENLTGTQQLVFILTGIAVVCFINAIGIASRRGKS